MLEIWRKEKELKKQQQFDFFFSFLLLFFLKKQETKTKISLNTHIDPKKCQHLLSQKQIPTFSLNHYLAQRIIMPK